MIHLKKLTLTLVALFAMTTGAWASEKTVTFNASTDGSTINKDGVTCTGSFDEYNNINSGGAFSVTSGQFTKIEVTGAEANSVGRNPTTMEEIAGWSTTSSVAIWTGKSSTVSFGSIMGNGQPVTIVFTIEGAAPAGTALTPDETRKVWTLEKMPASNVELQVEYYPAMLTLAASPADGGKVELDAAAAPVEWTPETWTNVSTTGQHGDLTSGDITLTATGGWLTKQEDGNLSLYSADNEYDHQTLTFSTTGDGFTSIELTMTSDANNHNPHITPADGWTFSGKSAVWEGEATKKLVCQNCTTTVSKITFYRGSGLPVGVEKDETGNIYVKSGTTVTVKATPEEGYEFAGWADDATITSAEREITMGDADLTVTANFTAKPYDVTLTAKNDFTIEAGKATVTVDGTAATPAEGKISGVTKGQKVAITAATGYKFRSATAKKGGAGSLGTSLTFEALTEGTITVSSPKDGMTYKLNGVDKGAVTSTAIEVAKDDKVEFYGTATSYNGTTFGGTAQVNVYGNIMSLVSADFATLPEPIALTADNTFAQLFKNYTTLKDASGLLLPATTLTTYCYGSMFMGCSNLTAAPKLPATTLASDCYWRMFKDCTSLKVAYVKAAYVSGPCTSMFYGCSAADATLHTTSDNKASWTGNVPGNWTIDEGWTD